MTEKLRETARQLLEAWDDFNSYEKPSLHQRIEALRAALSEPEPVQMPVQDSWEPLKQYGYAPGDYMSKCCICDNLAYGVDKYAITCRLCAGVRYAESQKAKRIPPAEPPKLRRGDFLRCAESSVLCTVWATSTSGKVLVKWGPNDFGSYTAEQIGELFWVEPRVQETGQEPYCHVYEYDSVFGLHREFYPHEYNGRKPDRTVPLFSAPPQDAWHAYQVEEKARAAIKLVTGAKE